MLITAPITAPVPARPLGALFLREPISARRILGGVGIAAGAICLAAL